MLKDLHKVQCAGWCVYPVVNLMFLSKAKKISVQVYGNSRKLIIYNSMIKC